MQDHQTILMLAAGSGNSGLVQFFLEKGCDINAKDKVTGSSYVL